jgi:hypothetical protein
MGPLALLNLRRKACLGFVSPSVVFEHAKLGSVGNYVNYYITEDGMTMYVTAEM